MRRLNFDVATEEGRMARGDAKADARRLDQHLDRISTMRDRIVRRRGRLVDALVLGAPAGARAGG